MLYYARTYHSLSLSSPKVLACILRFMDLRCSYLLVASLAFLLACWFARLLDLCLTVIKHGLSPRSTCYA